MSKHISRGLATVLIVTLLMIFAAVPVLAFDARTGDTITVASGEVVDDDLYVTAQTVTVDGTINGDLWAAATTITVNGAVTSSVMAAATTVKIGGEVDHAVRAVGRLQRRRAAHPEDRCQDQRIEFGGMCPPAFAFGLRGDVHGAR